MTVSKASLQALEASSRRRRADVDTRIDRALKTMRKRGTDINISSVAREAGVSRSVIHRRHDLRQQIEALHNARTVNPVPDDAPPPATDSDNSIIAALRIRLKAREAKITELKAQLRERDHIIATLHGELARKPHT